MSDMIAVAVADMRAGAVLDWAVVKVLGWQVARPQDCQFIDENSKHWLVGYYGDTRSCAAFAFRPSTSWEHGGPLIDQFDIWIAGPLEARRPTQAASVGIDGISAEGATKLEAAMKAIVANKFGDAVTVPRFLVEAKS